MKKILVIDDEDFIVEYVQAILEDQYEVTTAHNGQEGLKKYIEISPDLVILDLVMPIMDGYQFINKVQADDGDPNIIILTGAPDEFKGKVRYSSINTLVTKPFKVKDFLKTVKSALEDS